MSDLTDALGETEGQGGSVPSTQERDAGSQQQRTRDEGGRFARQDANPAGDEQQQAADGEGKKAEGEDPAKAAAARAEAREQRQAEFFRDMGTLHKELVQKINPPKAAEPEQIPEFWDDPNKATDHRIKGALDARFDPVMQRMQQVTIHYSERHALAEFGQEKVDAAKKALSGTLEQLKQTNPQLHAREFTRMEQQIAQSVDPVGDIVRWHQRQQQEQAITRVGGDPEKWMGDELKRMAADPAGREKLLALLNGEDDGAESQRQQQHQQDRSGRVALPPSLSKLPTGKSQPGGDMSDAALFSYATH